VKTFTTFERFSDTVPPLVSAGRTSCRSYGLLYRSSARGWASGSNQYRRSALSPANLSLAGQRKGTEECYRSVR